MYGECLAIKQITNDSQLLVLLTLLAFLAKTDKDHFIIKHLPEIRHTCKNNKMIEIVHIVMIESVSDLKTNLNC